SGQPRPTTAPERLDEVRRLRLPVPAPDRLPRPRHPLPEPPVAKESLDRPRELLVLEPIRVEPDPEPQLGDPLGVVVLIPEERQDDHRLAEVERLRRRVVP